MSRPNFKLIIPGIVLFMALLGAYANHFSNGFHFDDSHAIVDNVHIRSLKNIPSFFVDPRMFSADPLHWGLRPLVTTTLAIDYWLGGGLNPFYFQLSTFIWFMLLGLLLFFLYRNLLNRSGGQGLSISSSTNWSGYIALGATALYMLNVANAETVNYIISRSDVLSTLCIVASFLIYISFPSWRKWGLYILPALLGVFAKETVLVLVILLFFYDLLFEKELSVGELLQAKNWKKVLLTILYILPLLVVVLLAQLYTLSKAGTISGISNPLFPYLLTQAWVWLHYAIAFILPANLSADTDWTIISNYFDERIIAGLAFVALLFIAIFRTSVKKETKPVAFGLIWFSAALLPTSLAPFAEVANDHRMFFPFIGLALSSATYIGLWLVRIREQLNTAKFYRLLIGSCIVILASSDIYGIHVRNRIWATEESLWLDVTQKSPGNGRGLMNYGLTQMAAGKYGPAEEYFNKASATLPYYNSLYINLGILMGATSRQVLADEYFKKAITLSPKTDDGYSFYARYLNEKTRDSDAIVYANMALSINPYSVMSLKVLMSSYERLGRWDLLGKTSRKTLAVLPGDAQATAYLKAAINRTSLVNIPIGTKKQSGAADYLNMSLVYYNQQNFQKCIIACQQAIALRPGYADAYSNMGAAYNRLQQWDKGMAACKMALKTDPNHKLANGNLKWAQAELLKVR